MVRFFEIQGLNCRETLHQHLFVMKKKRRGRHIFTRKVEDPQTGNSHFQYGNGLEPADEPVDPTSEQNHMGPPGQFLTSLDSSGSVRRVSLKMVLSIEPHLSHERDNPHADDNCN